MVASDPQAEQPARRVESRSCDEHGSYEAEHIFGSIWTDCPACAERDRLKHVDVDAAAARAAEVTDEARQRATWSIAGIQPRFLAASLSSFEAPGPKERKALDWAVGYVDDWPAVRAAGRGAVLTGRPGTGKTHLACGVIKRLLEREPRFKGRIVSIQRMMRRIKATWGAGADETEAEAVAYFTSPDLLIIDEIGVQFGSVAEATLLYDIVNDRYVNLRPTILISNLPTDDLEAVVGERVWDRMKEGGGDLVTFGWASHRQ